MSLISSSILRFEQRGCASEANSDIGHWKKRNAAILLFGLVHLSRCSSELGCFFTIYCVVNNILSWFYIKFNSLF